jgi:hypothetical protein
LAVFSTAKVLSWRTPVSRIWKVANRAAFLASRYQDEVVFDPSPLEAQYQCTIHLAEFISENYEPIGRYAKNRGNEKYAPAVLAFAALLLYGEHWDVDGAAAVFGRIAVGASDADGDLGNVIGLNPWHDFEAWRQIKALQDLSLAMPAGAWQRRKRSLRLRQLFDVNTRPTGLLWTDAAC